MTFDALNRLRYKAKHGLVMQEILNTLGRRGVWISPYVVYCESREPVVAANEELAEIEFRELRPSDSEAIAAMEGYRATNPKINERFAEGGLAYGAFHHGQLVAINWANLKVFLGLGDLPAVRELESDEAYMHGAYTLREYRGRGIMSDLRVPFRRRLAEIGRHKCYSVNMLFNRSARRFKNKSGAQELELRLSVILFDRIRKDVRLRSLAG